MKDWVKTLTENSPAEFLLIRLKDETTFEWVRLSTRFEIITTIQNNPLTDLATLANGKILIVLIPGIDCSLFQTNLKIKNAAQLKQAIPYALEEILCEEVEDLHFVIDNQTFQQRVIVTHKAKIQHHLNILKEHAVFPNYFLPEYLIIPPSENYWRIVVEPTFSQVQINSAAGFSVDTDMLKLVIHKKMSEQEIKPDYIEIIDLRKNNPKTDWQWGDIPLKFENNPNNLLEFASPQLKQALPLNLLQGTFRRRLSWQLLPKPLKISAVLALAFISIFLLKDLLGIALLDYQADKLNTENVALFNQILPNTPIVDVHSQVEAIYQKLAIAQDDHGFLNLFSAVAEKIAQRTDVHLQKIDYATNQLSATLLTSNPLILNQIIYQLGQEGFKAKLIAPTTLSVSRISR